MAMIDKQHGLPESETFSADDRRFMRMAIDLSIRNVDEGMETLGPSYLTGGNAEWCSCFGEILHSFSES